jgi:hypothetical protein
MNSAIQEMLPPRPSKLSQSIAQRFSVSSIKKMLGRDASTSYMEPVGFGAAVVRNVPVGTEIGPVTARLPIAQQANAVGEGHEAAVEDKRPHGHSE